MLVDEGVAATKDVELGMMMGAGILPGPLTRADEAGLDSMLERLELAEREWGDGFAPPLLLRRLVNQGRLGQEDGPGLLLLSAARRGRRANGDGAARDPGRAGDPVAQPAADQPDLPAGDPRPDGALGRDRVSRRDPRGSVRLLELRRLLRRRRHQGVHEDDRSGCRQGAARRRPRRAASHGAVEQGDHRRRQLAGARRRLRAGDGLRLPDRGRIGELRPARDQPRDHPRVRRHAAAGAPGGGGEGARDEPARGADLGRAGRRIWGSPTRSSPTTSCSTPHSPGRASWPGRRRWRSSRSRRSRRRAIWTRGSRPRRAASRPPSHPRTRARGSPPSSASASRSGPGSSHGARAAAEELAALIREQRVHCRPDRGRGLGAVGDPGLPDAGEGPVGEGGPDVGGDDRRLSPRHEALLGLLPPPLPHAHRQAAKPGPRGAGRAGATRAAGGGDHPEHRSPASQGGVRAGDRGARLDRHRELHELRRQLPAGAGRVAVRHRRSRDLCLLRGQGEARRRPVRRAPAAGRDRGGGAAVRRRRPAALRRLLAGGLPGRRAPRAHPRGGREAGDRDPELDPVRLGGRRSPRRRRGRGPDRLLSGIRPIELGHRPTRRRQRSAIPAGRISV